jgi:outer membrane protein TolC
MCRRPRGSIIAILLAYAFAAPARSQTASVLTVDQAVQAAVEQNPALASAAIEPQKLSNQIAAMNRRRLPQFSFLGFGGQLLTRPSISIPTGTFGNFPATGEIPGSNVKLDTPERPVGFLVGMATLPLTGQYDLHLNIQMLRAQQVFSKEQYRENLEVLVASVRESYYGLVQTQASLEAMQQNVKLYQEMEREAKQALEVKSLLKADLLQTQARLLRATYQVTVLEDTAATQKESLNRLMGRDLAIDFQVDPLQTEMDWKAPDLDALRAEALNASPQVRKARLTVDIAHDDRRLKKSEWIPNTSLAVGSINTFGLSNVVPNNIAAAGIMMSWEPFDWGRKNKELSEKSEIEHQAELNLRDTEARVRLEVGQVLRKATEARALLASCRMDQELSNEKLRLSTARYSQHAALLQEVLDAQFAEATANEAIVRSLGEFWSAVAELQKITGVD